MRKPETKALAMGAASLFWVRKVRKPQTAALGGQNQRHFFDPESDENRKQCGLGRVAASLFGQKVRKLQNSTAKAGTS